MGSRLNRAVFGLKTRVVMREQRRVYARLQGSERLDPERLVAQQAEDSMALARHAFATTEHYRQAILASGLEAGDLDDPGSFSHLPILEKDTVREAPERLVSSAEDPRDRLRSTTGGSTGEPLAVYNDRRSPVAPMWWRTYGWWGVSPYDHRGMIYRVNHRWVDELRERLEWWPTRTVKLEARNTTPADLERWVRKWNRVRPRLLNGYVGSVHELASHVREHQLDFAAPRAIAVTASMLHDAERRDIEKILGAPVYDCYRSAEVPWIAAQCSHREGLHVLADLRRVEVVDPSGSPATVGTHGDVLVTDLTNRVFPLLRYRIGDRSRLRDAACSCGRTLPLMDPIDGRSVDVLRTPTGRVISGGLATLLNAHAHVLRRFQLHQSRDYTVEIRFVADRTAGAAAVAEAISTVVTDLKSMLGGEVAVIPREVADIPHEAGKVRMVVSEAQRPTG